MTRRRANEEMGDVEELGLQLTPMIDVIFQLLLFFLVTIKFPTNEGLLKAFLPRHSTEPVTEDDRKDIADTYIQQDADGHVHLTVGLARLGTLEVFNAGRSDEQVALVVGEASVSLENQYTMLRNALEGSGESLKVVIKAESELPYKYVVYVLNVCGRLKIEDVMFGKPGRAAD